MGYFYLLIIEILLLYSIFSLFGAIVFVLYNYYKFWKIKATRKKVSWSFLAVFLLIFVISLITILFGSLWFYAPEVFSSVAYSERRITQSTIWIFVAFSFSLIMLIFLAFFSKYGFIILSTKEPILFGLKYLSKKQKKPKFVLKKSLVAKEYFAFQKKHKLK